VSAAGWTLFAVTAQAVFLAAAAFFAWRAYRASVIEQRRAPRRRLLEDAIAELKGVAQAVDLESRTRLHPEVIRGHQQRLRIALAPIPTMLPDAVEVAYGEATQITRDQLDSATSDLLFALRWLEIDPSGLGENAPIGDDRHPLQLSAQPVGLRERWGQSRLRWRFRRVRGLFAARFR
jgi:hypothetical protein